MDLIFDHTQSCDEVERIMTDYVNVKQVPLKASVPTVLNYSELSESRMFEFYHPGDVGKIIHGVLESFGPERDWEAGVYFDYNAGFTHVFFAKNQEIIQLSAFINNTVVGTA